jgi:hypothetical protein
MLIHDHADGIVAMDLSIVPIISFPAALWFADHAPLPAAHPVVRRDRAPDGRSDPGVKLGNFLKRKPPAPQLERGENTAQRQLLVEIERRSLPHLPAPAVPVTPISAARRSGAASKGSLSPK